jgi:hypothetical protein
MSLKAKRRASGSNTWLCYKRADSTAPVAVEARIRESAPMRAPS